MEAGGGGSIIGPAAATPIAAACLATTRPDDVVLLVTATTRAAEDLADELKSLLGERAVAEFPAWETLPHERLSPTQDVVGRRISVVQRLNRANRDNNLRVVVMGIRAFMQPVVKGLERLKALRLRAGDDYDFDEAVSLLAAIGYQRTDLVTRRGEFAVRGGIIDVFVPTDEHPVRIEFFGDQVDEVRTFAVSDQRSLELVDGVVAPPCREVLLTKEVRDRAAALRDEYPELSDIFGQLAEGIYVEGMESLAPVLTDGMESILDVMGEAAVVLVDSPERVRGRAIDLAATSEEFLAASWLAAADGGATPIDVSDSSYFSYDELAEQASDRHVPWWTIGPFDSQDSQLAAAIRLDIKELASYRADLSGAVDLLRGSVRRGDATVVVASGSGAATRLAQQLAERDLPSRLVSSLDAAPAQRVITVTSGPLRAGFELPGLLVITEAEFLGSARRAAGNRSNMPTRRKRGIDPLALEPGDFIVHEQHGVGKFVEMAQRTVSGAVREYLVVEYAASKRGQPPDRLYVPTDQLDQVSRYVGGEAPSVHRLGGADWTKAKSRARRAVRQIAGELVRLYATRQAAKGFAFSPDTPWQAELEDSFAFVETADQLSTIEDVKADMERSVPMDRVICGDVGYGKTEIAVRAAFKAVQDGKQVAVLVPTTLLVRQHEQTFRERFAQFPVRVEALSRFQTKKQTEAVLADIEDGTVDVVIATHRLLSPNTRFKDLGLVIIDEEQRFGVEHKEHLKALRTNVDMLTMSATPIPRTLEMAVTGIREMSTITTPPEQRLPVLTYVGPFDDKQITAAVRRELLRDGQVFFVHNRVESIERAARRIADLVPEARIAVAHGQMSEGALEKVIDDFWERRIDVLVCTTIVENGLDITNANTLIVDRADTFGISQLHQLRGRVGRGRDRGYAYFFYSPERTLSETAHERLATIASHTDLGSGMAVAMKDLEIRGAGNLLGGEQSGHIADVGFDLYVRMVGEALSDFRGEDEAELAEVTVELPVDAHIPESYIGHERLRLAAYQELAAAHSQDKLDQIKAELIDRFGQLPDPVVTLFKVAELRNLARSCHLSEIVVAGNRIRFAPVELPESRTMRLTRLYPGAQIRPATRTVLVNRPVTAKVAGKPVVGDALIEWVREFVENILVA